MRGVGVSECDHRGVIGDKESGSKVEEKLVHLTMVVKFKVLIEKKRMCSLGLMMFDWWIEFWMVHLEELVIEEVVVDEVWW
ncbi:hypothetical protein Tco_0364130 [Tanacetum coccineum]